MYLCSFVYNLTQFVKFCLINDMIFFTSDLHFGHNNIIPYCKRPFIDAHDMNKKLTDNWNSIVTPQDTVYHLGDFSFHSKPSVYESNLNGKIIHIKGNHDRGEHWLDFALLRLGNKDIFIKHNPDDYQNVYPYADLILHGHVHEKYKHQVNHKGVYFINVGCDVWDYKPVNIDQIFQYIGKVKLLEKAQ